MTAGIYLLIQQKSLKLFTHLYSQGKWLEMGFRVYAD